MKYLRLGFLVSHGGSNMQAIIDACRNGNLNATARVVISNNPDAFALERAKKEKIPAFCFNSKTDPNSLDLDLKILKTLQEHNVDLVILAGYMRMLGNKTLSFYKNRILNIHPALLPKFGGVGMYGQFVHKAVIDAKESTTGVTIHLVSNKYDQGSIVAQATVPVLANDTPQTLSERVLAQEHKLFWQTLKKISLGKIDLDKIAS